MKSIDCFLARRKTKDYNCFDFVREVWLYWTGEDVANKLTGLTGRFKDRRPNISGVRAFTRIQEPINPCFIVLLRRPFVPHVGIYIDGEMLHLRDSGVVIEPLQIAKGHFSSIRFYK